MQEVMDVKAVASYLGISTSKVYKMLENGEIPASRVGRQYRFLKEAVDDWLRENMVTNHKG